MLILAAIVLFRSITDAQFTSFSSSSSSFGPSAFGGSGFSRNGFTGGVTSSSSSNTAFSSLNNGGSGTTFRSSHGGNGYGCSTQGDTVLANGYPVRKMTAQDNYAIENYGRQMQEYFQSMFNPMWFPFFPPTPSRPFPVFPQLCTTADFAAAGQEAVRGQPAPTMATNNWSQSSNMPANNNWSTSSSGSSSSTGCSISNGVVFVNGRRIRPLSTQEQAAFTQYDQAMQDYSRQLQAHIEAQVAAALGDGVSPGDQPMPPVAPIASICQGVS